MTAGERDREVARAIHHTVPMSDQVFAIAEAIAAERKQARIDQQAWDRQRVETYADVVGIDLPPSEDMADAVDELYQRGIVVERERVLAPIRALAEELEGHARALVERPDQMPAFHGRQIQMLTRRLRAALPPKPITEDET
jgi:hypothetical protein